MQNLSQNQLNQITKMQNLSQNKLEKIAKMRRIKNYKNMSIEDLLTALLKSGQDHPELCRIKDNNELKNRFSKQKMKKIRRKFQLREGISKYLKELETKNSLTEQEKRDKNITSKN